ncbi:MAG: hypothetical protein KGI00_01355 [Candidatus Micrarchaeota archaeon]|nr:hypothetical protein [Candidatus Micrarchaeota archaeon]MDE1824077.1 hypothetical protein [Candidatus Micrarchaeota archaeon]MDE1849356.1 hypothetical protein [Candidatus Micrarchaeota archaeon]
MPLRGWSLILFITLIPSAAFAESIGAQHYSPAQANAIISNVSSYLRMVNSSAYLVFEPNLTLAYSYLNKSEAISGVAPDQAVSYADKAFEAGKAEYLKISYFRTLSVPVMVAFTCAIALLLYRYMRPVNSKRGR